MKKNVIENKIDKGVNIEFNFKDINDKIDYDAKRKTGRISFKWVAPAFTCCLVALLGVVLYGITNSSKDSAAPEHYNESSIEIARIKMVNIMFTYNEVNYLFDNQSSDLSTTTFELFDEKKVDLSIVGNYLTTINYDQNDYQIYECLEDKSLLVKYNEEIYVKANPYAYTDNVTAKFILEHALDLKDSEYTTTTQNMFSSIKEVYGTIEFSKEDVDSFFFELLNSTPDDKGFQTLSDDIYKEAKKRGVVTPTSSYSGSIKETHQLVITLANGKTISLNYYETNFIHSPRYVFCLNKYFKLSEEGCNLFTKYYPDTAD